MKMFTILGDWIHTYEFDTANTKVYARVGEILPPSRGRQRLSFYSDGIFTGAIPGSDDRIDDIYGTYQLEGTKLVLNYRSGSPSVVYELILDSDGKHLRLVRV